MPEDNLDDISMSLYNSNYFTSVGYVSNKMSQKELLHEKKQFAATVKKPNYTEPLKIAKLLQLETWPACKNPAKCQVPTVRFKPDIALVVEEVQVDQGDGDGDGGDDDGDDGSGGDGGACGDGGGDGSGGDSRDGGDGNDDDGGDDDDDDGGDDDDDGCMKGIKCTKKSQSTKSKKAKVEVVAQVHRQEGDKEEEEEEVLEQGEEGDQNTRPQPSTSQAGLTTQAATAQSVTTPTPIRRSGRKVTLTQMYTPGTALTSPTGSEGPPGAPRGASAKHSLQGKGKKRKIVDPDLTPPKLDTTKWTVGGDGDGDNPEQGAADPDARSRFAFHSPIVIVETEGYKKNWDQSSYASKAMCELPSSLAFSPVGFVIYVFHNKVVIVSAWHRVKDMTIHTSCKTISMQESHVDLLQQWKYLTKRLIEILIVQIKGLHIMPKQFLNGREKTVVITLVTLALTLRHYVRSVSTVMIWMRSIQSITKSPTFLTKPSNKL